MGDYSTIVTKFTLKRDRTAVIIDFIRLWLSDSSNDLRTTVEFAEELNLLESHTFFSKVGWQYLFSNATGTTWFKREYGFHDDGFRINCVSSVKDYDQLVALFFSWIRPYIDFDKNPVIFSVRDDRNDNFERVVRLYTHDVNGTEEISARLRYLDVGYRDVRDRDGKRLPEYSLPCPDR